MHEAIGTNRYDAARHSLDPERDLVREFEGREYISEAEFYSLLRRARIDLRLQKKGTFFPDEEGNVFIYAKPDFICKDLESAQKKLAYCQEMTALGALFPRTQWGIFQRESGNFHVFAITRKLEIDEEPRDDPQRNAKIVLARVGEIHKFDIDQGEVNSNPMGREPGSTELYPVDVEIIALPFDEHDVKLRELEFQDSGREENIGSI